MHFSDRIKKGKQRQIIDALLVNSRNPADRPRQHRTRHQFVTGNFGERVRSKIHFLASLLWDNVVSLPLTGGTRSAGRLAQFHDHS